MVFVPTKDTPTEPHEPAAVPKRVDHVAPPEHPDASARLPWRAIVHPAGDQSIRTTWHMAGCGDPSAPAAHCETGQSLMTSAGDPDGHCLINGNCLRCAVTDV
jgi:hypothetical protein